MKKLHFSKLLFLSISIISLTFFSACSKKEDTSGLKILRFGNGTEPSGLDPHVVTGVPEHHILLALFEGLSSPNPKTLAPEPGMAESWTVSDDLKTYTFNMRKDAKWSNGDPVTAHDFEYSWKRILTPTLASEYAYMLHIVKNAEKYNKGELKDWTKVGAKATDASTFVVNLEAPTPYFLSLLHHYSTWPVHKATIEKHGAWDNRNNPWTRPGNIVSNGPFTLKRWEINKILVVAKNPNHWQAKNVHLDEVHFSPIDNEQTEERNFRAGKLHVTSSVPIHKIGVYKEKNPDLIHIDPYLGTYYYRVNVTKKPLSDKRIRKALALALDRNTIVEKVSKGGQLPAFAYTPPNTAGYTSKTQLQESITEAKKLLAEAGYPDGKGLPAIEILYNTNEGHKKIAVAIQEMWKTRLGVDITLNNQEWKVYLNSQKSLNYQVSRAGWIGDYNDPNSFLDMFLTDGGNNQTGWSNKEYDMWVKKASTESNLAKRLEYFQNAEKILMTEGPVIPIYTYTRIYLKSPKLTGWYPNILSTHPYVGMDIKE